MDVCDAAPQPALRPGVASVAVGNVIELVRQYASLDRRISDGRMQSFLRTIIDCNMNSFANEVVVDVTNLKLFGQVKLRDEEGADYELVVAEDAILLFVKGQAVLYEI